MLLKTALVKVRLCAAVKDAIELRSSLSVAVIVNLHMLFEVACRSESFTASLTLERFLACVDPLVPDEIRDLTKPQPTAFYLTDERLLLIVHPGVFLQRRILSELLVALITIDA